MLQQWLVLHQLEDNDVDQACIKPYYIHLNTQSKSSSSLSGNQPIQAIFLSPPPESKQCNTAIASTWKRAFESRWSIKLLLVFKCSWIACALFRMQPTMKCGQVHLIKCDSIGFYVRWLFLKFRVKVQTIKAVRTLLHVAIIQAHIGLNVRFWFPFFFSVWFFCLREKRKWDRGLRFDYSILCAHPSFISELSLDNIRSNQMHFKDFRNAGATLLNGRKCYGNWPVALCALEICL